MHAFYIDEQLSPEETLKVLNSLNGLRKDKIQSLSHKRIPYVIPVTGAETITTSDMANMFSKHLINAGAAWGDQCLFVMPREGIRWAMSIQQAFVTVTGSFPYTVQPWAYENKQLVRRKTLFVVDLQAAMNL